NNADVGARPIDAAAAGPDRTAGRRNQTGGDHQQRALAASARPDVAEEFAAPLGKGNLVERAHVPVARRVDLGQILDAQIGLNVVCGGAHAVQAAQASCGGTNSAPVGTNSLV